ncbi:MAG: TonB-dependent receptor [Rikenellaceae bacterium]|nr:TonB-dependent receptor [Rikenellaceae bacterium]
MKRYLLALLILALPIVASAASDSPQHPNTEIHNRNPKKATDANIFGHVVSANSGEHLPYATIAVKGTTLGCAANGTGHYSIHNLPLGELVLVVSAIGYETKEITYVALPRTSDEINFSLLESTTVVDEVVVSATRNETNRRQTATVVNVASTKLFEGTASANLSEAMNFQSGLRVENTCGNCGAPQLRINGLEGQYSQILLDSRAIFSSLAGVYGLDLMPVAMVERVEVIRGGGSALFGSNAIGGVVNIITKDPVRNTLSLSNTTNIMEDGTPDINTSLGGAFVSDDYKLGTYIFGQVKSRGGYDRNDDGFSDLTKLRSETAGFRTYYKTSAHSRLTAEYHHIHEFRRGGDNFDEAPHMALLCEQLDHTIDGGGLRFDLFPNTRHRASVYASAQGISRSSYFGANMNPDAYGMTKDFTFVGGAQYTLNYKAGLPSELTVGAEYNLNNLNDTYIATNRKLDQQTSTYGLFAQNEWKTEKLNILIGFRLDKHNMIDRPIFAPRANIRYSPIESIGLRLSYSSGYRAPQAYNEDLHIDALNHSVSIIEIDPNLRPEFSHSLSASADIYHSFGRLQTNLLIEGFYTMLNDVFTLENNREEIDSEGNQFIYKQRRNAAGARVGGITAELKLGITQIFDLQLGYTFQKSQYVEPEQWSEDVVAQRRMFRSPDHYGYLSSNFYITKQFNASLFGTFTGPMLVQHAAHTTPEGIEVADSEVITPSFWDFGLKLGYTFRLSNVISLEVNAGVKNIFDSYQRDIDRGAGRDSAYIFGPSLPRTYFFGVKLFI